AHPPCLRLCPAHPGNPRRNIEGESPHLWKGHTVCIPTAIVTTPNQHLTQGRRPHMTRGGSHRGGESNERGRPTLALFARPNRPIFFTSCRNCRTTVEGSARRDARLRRTVDCGEPFSRRYTTPSICIRCMDAGTRAIPSPTATKPRLDVTRGARWTTRGLNPEARHAAIVAS